MANTASHESKIGLILRFRWLTKMCAYSVFDDH